MKITHKLLLLLSIFYWTTIPQELNLTPQNTIIITDLDEVLMQKALFISILAQLKYIVGYYKKDAAGTEEALTDKNGNAANSVTFHLLYYGMQKPYLAAHVAWMVNNLERSHCLIDGTAKIYHYLKDIKGYTIVFATNKDRISYDINAQTLGNTLTGLVSKVFVAQPGNSPELIQQLQTFADLPTTPASYKELLHKAVTIQPTAHILHAPRRKPDLAYYQYVEQNIDKHKNMIFIDDKAINVAGFEALKNNSSAQRIGIVFTDPQQLAQELINLGILSETEDAALLENIRYPGIWGAIQLFGKKLMTKLTTPATALSARG